MWFESWDQILRVVIIRTVSYATPVVILQASGKRTLSQLIPASALGSGSAPDGVANRRPNHTP